MTSAPSPRLTEDLRTERVEKNGRTFIRFTTPRGPINELLSERTFEVLSTLSDHETLDDWFASVIIDDPSVSKEKLVSLLDRCTRLGILTSKPQAFNSLNTGIHRVVGLPPPASGRPKARTDLVAKPGPRADLLSVTNPKNGRTFQVYAFEIQMLKELDGNRDLDELLAAFAAKGQPITQAQLARFIREMTGYGFLEDSGGVDTARKLVGTPWNAPPEAEVSFTRWSEEERQLYDAGVKLFREGAMQQAEGYFKATLEVNPDNREARKMLTMLALAPGGGGSGDEYGDGSGHTVEVAVGALGSLEDAAPPAAGGAPPAAAADGAPPGAPGGAAPDGVWDEAAQQVQSAPDVGRRRTINRLIRVGRVIALPLVAILAAAIIRYPLKVTYSAVVKPLDRCVIRAPRDGVIGDVLVDEGQKVAANDILGHMADADQKTKVVQIRSELEKSKAELELLKAGSREEEVDKVRARVGGLFHEITVAKARRARVAGLVKQGVAARGELDAADAAIATLSGELAQASAELKLVKAGARADDIKKKEAEVRSSEAKLEFEKQVLDSAVLKTELAGIVTTTKPKNLVNSRVAPGDIIFEVASFEAMRAEIMVNERDFDVLKLGLPVSLKVASHPTESFTGEVTRIAPQVEVQDNQSVIRVEARIANERALLVPNMTGYAEIQAEPKPILSLAVRRVLRWVRVRFLI